MPDLDTVISVETLGIADTPVWWALGVLAVVWVAELAVFARWLRRQLNPCGVASSTLGLSPRDVRRTPRQGSSVRVGASIRDRLQPPFPLW